MTDITILDHRRTDLRTNTLGNPYWLTSGQITKADDDLAALLFSFPITKSVSPGYRPLFIEQIVFEVEIAFIGGTPSILIASGTLATDAVTTGGVVTEVDADEYMLSDNITEATIGFYPACGAGTDSDWMTAKLAGNAVHPYIIVPADTAVPCIYASLSSGSPITAGSGRLHILIAEMP